jgi:hypothetical protein
MTELSQKQYSAGHVITAAADGTINICNIYLAANLLQLHVSVLGPFHNFAAFALLCAALELHAPW